MKIFWKIQLIAALILVAYSLFLIITTGFDDSYIIALCFALIAATVSGTNVCRDYKDDRTIRCFDCGSEWIRVKHKKDLKYAKDILYILGWVQNSHDRWICKDCAHARRCPDEVSPVDG